MTKPPDKIFVRPNLSVRVRAVRRETWTHEAQPAFSILCVRGGQAVWRLRTDPLNPQTDVAMNGNVAAGDVLLFNPTEAWSVDLNDAEVLFITAGSSFVYDCAVRARMAREDARIEFRQRAVSHKVLSRYVDDMQDELQVQSAGHELMLSASVEQLLVYLLRHHVNIARTGELELSRVGLVDRRIRRAVELMHAQLAKPLTLDQLAAEAYLSPFHFARLFRKATGASPHSYLAALRNRHAQELLATTDRSINRIASQVGYNSASHFTKAFRQQNQISPREFRRALVK